SVVLPSPLRGGIEVGRRAVVHRWHPTPSPSPLGGGERDIARVTTGIPHARRGPPSSGNCDMRILVIGSGGREHALAWAISRSPRVERLFVAPGNGGTETIAENAEIDITDHGAVLAFAKANRVDFVVIGPDAPA